MLNSASINSRECPITSGTVMNNSKGRINITDIIIAGKSDIKNIYDGIIKGNRNLFEHHHSIL